MMNENQQSYVPDQSLFDCIIIGAGPGGLQAAIYLGRYNRKVLLVDRGGGRTAHAKMIENFLTWKAIAGKEIIERGIEQARAFNVRIEKGVVTSVAKTNFFEVATREASYRSKHIIISTGIYDILPPLENLPRFFGISFFTCIDCDGYKTRGKSVAVLGDSIDAVRLAMAMRELYSPTVSLILSGYDPPPDYREELRDRGIKLIKGEPIRILGRDAMEAVELRDGALVSCETIMANYGHRMNDSVRESLQLKRSKTGSFIVNSVYESSLSGLYIVGPLNTGNDQVVIAAGEGAVAAIDINKRLLEF
jgi:thioredoxin reductase (NADPH)